MPLSWSFAHSERDKDEFAAFSCWNGDSLVPWVKEVENYVRVWVLRDAKYVLAFRDHQDNLVAVAAFDERVVKVPIVQPANHPGWHLVVIAIRLEDQNKGLSSEIFNSVFDAMRSVDSDRVLYTANVHKANRASIEASKRVGLLPFLSMDEHYWILLGEVPKDPPDG